MSSTDPTPLPSELVARLRQFPAPTFTPHRPARVPIDEVRRRVAARLGHARTRRSVRHFSPEPVPIEVLRDLVAIAAQAPSGANRQPWRFVIVVDAELKRRIRAAAENEERRSYEERMPDEWLEALAPLGVDWRKPFLEVAPALIVMFKREREAQTGAQGIPQVRKAYYAAELCGIAAGMLIAAIHEAGLATLTHTPSPMGFLGEIWGTSPGERPYLLLPVGYPADDCVVPDIGRKSVDEVCEVR